MNAPTEADLVRAVQEHFPIGFPPEQDDPDTQPPLYQRTPEFRRWQAAWDQALRTAPPPWETLVEQLRADLPGHPELGTYTPAYHASCYAIVLYLRSPPTNGQEGYRLVRVAGAVSLIAPVYLVYGTLEFITPRQPSRDEQLAHTLDEFSKDGTWEEKLQRIQQQRPPGPQLHLQPTAEMRPHADLLARIIEHAMGYRAFPLALADVRIPGIRVPYLLAEAPTLLNTLFLKEPQYLL